MAVAHATKDDAVNARAHVRGDVVVHHLELASAIGEVSPTRANHRHKGDVVLATKTRSRTNDPHGGRRAPACEIVTELDPLRPRPDGGRYALHVLRTELPE